MKRLMYSTWNWNRAVKVAFALCEAPIQQRFAIESSRALLDDVEHWRWHVYRVR